VTARPLAGIRVVDFTMRLPGPLATHILARAGADVTKIEPPGGDQLDLATPLWPEAPAMYATLNGDKRVVRLNLKDERGRERLAPLLADADVVVEGFRPGVMERLGLDYARVSASNPRVVYCSLTGYGQAGERSARAGHDLSYLAESGALSLMTAEDGASVVPGTLIADIGAGAYAAVTNIALALFARASTGRGTYLDCAIAENLMPFVWWGRVNGAASGRWPLPAGDLFTGGTARYHLYDTSDGRQLAVAAIEPQFWERFCDAIDLDRGARNDVIDPAATIAAVEACIRARDAAYWRATFERVDACCAIVSTVEEACRGERELPDLDAPLAPAFRAGSRRPGH
jgi:crotonobetainyl-CoA:carnitine CoA-transferase CaiB-like acyl-CoA transferase